MATRTQWLTLVTVAIASAWLGAYVLAPDRNPGQAGESGSSSQVLENKEEPTPLERMTREPESPPPRVVEVANQDLQEQIQTLQHEKTQIQQQLTDFLNWLLVNYKGRIPLPESYMAKLRLSPINEDMVLNAEVAQILNITPDEEAVLNDAFRATETFLNEMETAIMDIYEEEPGKIVVQVPAFSEEGRLIREDLLVALEATLGAERFDRFMDVSEAELEETFLEFGEKARTIVFEVVYDENSDEPWLQIKDGWIAVDENQRKIVTATQITVPELPEEYGSYIDWLADQPTDQARP